MKKNQIRVLALALALSIALSGCVGGDPSAEPDVSNGNSTPPITVAKPYPEETPGPDYGWISGESPIPARRIGLYRQGIMQIDHGFECTDTGVYFLSQVGTTNYLFYGDHGSDTIIKLCGRPDCDHNNEDCNANFKSSYNICYYGGYLYTLTHPIMERKYKLIRMDPDGSNRVAVLEFSPPGNRNGLSGIMIRNGVFTTRLTYLDENGEQHQDPYYYRLDGSMENMEPLNIGSNYFSDGDNIVVTNRSTGESACYIWDPADNSLSFLHNWVGVGYYGAEDAYYIRDGVIYRLNYAEDREEALLDTGLEGYESLACFPDCLVVGMNTISDDSQKIAYTTLYFYNWAFEPLGQVKLEFTQGNSLSLAVLNFIAGETAERIILSESFHCIPRYYIEKSDFGTGNIEVHEYYMPDIDWDEIGSIYG